MYRPKRHTLNWFAAIVMGMLLIHAPLPCPGAPASSQQDLTPQQIATRALPAIVGLTIRDKTGNPVASGSGVVIGKNMVATCWHVVNGAHMVTANFSDGRSETAPMSTRRTIPESPRS
jgi:S1-C subfamily serine protease